jgi:hypothetical protein
VLELRPAHDPTKDFGFVNVVVNVTDLTSSIWTWHRSADGSWAVEKTIEIPPEPAETDQLPPALQPFGGPGLAGTAGGGPRPLDRPGCGRLRHLADGRRSGRRALRVRGRAAGFRSLQAAQALRAPTLVGMRVGGGQLCLWSFLMASAHGAGLMLIPALGSATARAAVASDPHVATAGLAVGSAGLATTVVLVHTMGMFIVTAVVAVLVYDRLGLAFLRTSWLNVDMLWAAALLLSGFYVLAIGLE